MGSGTNQNILYLLIKLTRSVEFLVFYSFIVVFNLTTCIKTKSTSPLLDYYTF